MEVINMNRILYNLVAKLIRFAVSDTGFYSPTRHPNCHGMGIVIAAVVAAPHLSVKEFAAGGAAELAAAQDESVIQQPARLEVA